MLKPYYQKHPNYYNDRGEQVPSVTTVLAILQKDFMIPWVVKLAKQNKDYRVVSSEASRIGTLAHAKVQGFIEGEAVDDYGYPESHVEAANTALMSFKEWSHQHDIEPIFCEKMFVHQELDYGGTVDAFMKVDGVPTIIDFKTSKSISSGYYTQLAAYNAVMAQYGYRAEQVAVLRLSKELGVVATEYRTMDMEDLELHWEFFQALLKTYSLKAALEERK